MSLSAKQKRDALVFWEKHGLAATMDHTGHSRSSRYAWHRGWCAIDRRALHDRSRALKQRHRRKWPAEIITHIRELRRCLPNCGKEKLQVLLVPWCAGRRLPCAGARPTAAKRNCRFCSCRGAPGAACRAPALAQLRQRETAGSARAVVRRAPPAVPRCPPNCGKEKLQELLVPWSAGHRLPCAGARPIERLVANAPDKMRGTPLRLDPKGRPRPLKRKFRPRLGRKGRTAIPGHCVAFDTVLRFINGCRNGCRQSIFTVTDHASRFRFAFATNGIHSRTAMRFAGLVKTVLPGSIRQVLSDNGSEFAGAWDEYAKQQGWRHCYTYPRCPKRNACSERFKRTVQEECVDYQEDLPSDDRRGFNDCLLEDWQREFNS